MLSDVPEFTVNESNANYFKVDLKSIDSKRFCEEALSNGIIIRDLRERFGINSIRVSIRDKKDNNRFIKIVNKILNNKLK